MQQRTVQVHVTQCRAVKEFQPLESLDVSLAEGEVSGHGPKVLVEKLSEPFDSPNAFGVQRCVD